ncbi:type II toxin-antitoxin system HicB family antitoxin [bacterium]|nr:type II toxin-antitoxin system HicB family antitoxin [bacterium]
MKFSVTLEEGEDGWIIASCPALTGCHSQGRTRDEALENIKEAILAWLEAEEVDASQQSSSGADGITVVEVAT